MKRNKHGFKLKDNYVPDHVLMCMSLREYNISISALSHIDYLYFKHERLGEVLKMRRSCRGMRGYQPMLDQRIKYTEKAIRTTELKISEVICEY